MTSIAERVPDITTQARQVRPGRLLLTILAGVFFVLGWVPGRLFLGVVWCCVAVKVGWQAGTGRGPARTDR